MPHAPKKKVTRNSALIKWDAQPFVASYTLQLLNNKGKKIKTFKNITTTKKLITNLIPGVVYEVQLRAVYVTEEATKFSKAVTVRTKSKKS